MEKILEILVAVLLAFAAGLAILLVVLGKDAIKCLDNDGHYLNGNCYYEVRP